MDSTTPSPHPAVDDAVINENPLALVVFDQRTQALHRPNPSAAYIWMMCDGKTSVAQMAAELVDVFGIAETTARSGVEAALEDFWSAGLLAGSPEPHGTLASAAAHFQILPREPDP